MISVSVDGQAKLTHDSEVIMGCMDSIGQNVRKLIVLHLSTTGKVKEDDKSIQLGPRRAAKMPNLYLLHGLSSGTIGGSSRTLELHYIGFQNNNRTLLGVHTTLHPFIRPVAHRQRFRI
jgi:hypothetical protein